MEAKIVRVLTANELAALKVETEVSLIPVNSSYCYESITQSEVEPTSFPITNLCPYWRLASDKPDQLNGYCLYLRKGDWEDDGTFVLFDQVKECGVNLSAEYDYKYVRGCFDTLIRSYYLEVDPKVARYFSIAKGDFVDGGKEESAYTWGLMQKKFGNAKKVYNRLFRLGF